MLKAPYFEDDSTARVAEGRLIADKLDLYPADRFLFEKANLSSFPSRVHRFCLDSNPFQILFKVAYLEAPVSVVNLGVRDRPPLAQIAQTPDY
jgi:hypothetical protein